MVGSGQDGKRIAHEVGKLHRGSAKSDSGTTPTAARDGGDWKPQMVVTDPEATAYWERPRGSEDHPEGQTN